MRAEQHAALERAVRLYKEHLRFYDPGRYSQWDYETDVQVIAAPLIAQAIKDYKQAQIDATCGTCLHPKHDQSPFCRAWQPVTVRGCKCDMSRSARQVAL